MPEQGRRRRCLPPTPLLLAAVAAAVYANTLTAQFTFDDSFAIVSAVVQEGWDAAAACVLAKQAAPPHLLLLNLPAAPLWGANRFTMATSPTTASRCGPCSLTTFGMRLR